MPGKLEGKVAVVTGGSRGLGAAIGETFAREGAKVVLAARTWEPHPKIGGTLQQAAARITAAGGTALPVVCNIANEADIQNLAKTALAAFGGVDILVNPAAANMQGSMTASSVQRWDVLMNVNLRAFYVLVTAFLDSMKGRGGGHIISVSPRADRMAGGGSFPGPYAFSKESCTRLALLFADELRQHGIAVNCLWPDGTRRTEGMIAMRGPRMPDALSPQLFADAALAIVTKDPKEYTGRTLLDTEALREAGVTDLGRYRVEEGA